MIPLHGQNPNSGEDRKTTNEKPVLLNPIGFDDALRDLLAIPPSQEPKEQERKQRKAGGTKKKSSPQ